MACPLCRISNRCPPFSFALQAHQQAWPAAQLPSAALQPVPSKAGPAAAASSGDLEGATAAAAFQRLAAQQQGQQGAAAAQFYSLLGAHLHGLLGAARQQDSNAVAAAGPTLLRAAAAAGEATSQWLLAEAAALRCLVAAAAGDTAAQTTAAQQLLRCGGPPQAPLLWPPLEQPGGAGVSRWRLWADPLAAAVLAPPAPAAGHALAIPAELLTQLPPRLQALLLESLLPSCSPAVAEAAVGVAQRAYSAAAASAAEERQPLWRYPVLSWVLAAAATSLASSIPAAAPHLWHQVCGLCHRQVLETACAGWSAPHAFHAVPCSAPLTAPLHKRCGCRRWPWWPACPTRRLASWLKQPQQRTPIAWPCGSSGSS